MGSGPTPTQYAEDTFHLTGSTITMSLALINDVLDAIATTDVDYTPLQVNDDGVLYKTNTEFISTDNITTSNVGGQTTINEGGNFLT